MTIIEHDFGHKKRSTVKRFGKLLGLDALHEENIRANPLPYLERASERIFQLESALFEAAQVFADDKADALPAERIQIDRREYLRLLKCRRVVEQALAEYASNQEY